MLVSGSWWDNSSPSQRRLTGSKERTVPPELRHGPDTICGSSLESWSMDESLNQRYHSAMKAQVLKHQRGDAE